MNTLKNTLLLTAFVLFLSACGGGDQLEKLNANKTKLETKIKGLESELKEIETEIAELDTSAAPEVKKELITVIDIAPVEFNHYIEGQGRSFAENNVMVTTDMGGLVKGVYVDEGQFVGKGKTLVQLDNSVILNQISEINTSMNLAKDVYEKRERLWKQNIGSEIDYLQAKNNYESLQDKLATTQTQLSKTAVRAPISGYVDHINVQVGEMASPGVPVVQVVNTTQMEIHADLPEIYLGSVKRKDEILVEIPALGITRSATVKSVGQTISTNNRTFKVIASINNKGGEIKPNLLAKIKINDENVKEAVTIPPYLLQESSNNGYYVFVVKEDSVANSLVAHRAIVEIGSSYGESVLITKGLEIGDQIIDAGYRDVREGKLVEIKQEQE